MNANARATDFDSSAAGRQNEWCADISPNFEGRSSDNITSCEVKSVQNLIPTVIITGEESVSDDDSEGQGKLSIGTRQAHRLDSVGSGTSVELYATAAAISTDYDSSLDDHDMLYTAADWTNDNDSSGCELEVNPAHTTVIVEVELSSDECEELSENLSGNADNDESVEKENRDNSSDQRVPLDVSLSFVRVRTEDHDFPRQPAPTCVDLSAGISSKDEQEKGPPLNGVISDSTTLVSTLECDLKDDKRDDIEYVVSEHVKTNHQTDLKLNEPQKPILQNTEVENNGLIRSNNIKDSLTMRRRREDGGGDQEEAEEQLMGEERRGSEDGSHFEIRGDEWNLALLLGLYLLQGIPLGLCATIPMIIQNRGVSFKQQAEFSFTMWPFSLKLLWAPLVDALYYPSFGRRKTWLVPAQYLIGFFMIFLSFHIDGWLNSEDPQVTLLTLMFFAMNFLAATQDIAVDGWALTMLKRQNKSLASMCNSVGQTAGFFLGYVVFMALESATFCNSYLRSEPSDVGIITLPGGRGSTMGGRFGIWAKHKQTLLLAVVHPGFLYFWGSIYLLMTTLVAFIKRENLDVGGEAPSVRAAFGSYHLLLRILKLPNIQLFSLILLTGKIGFAAFDGVTSLKFIEKGVPKEKLAVLAVPIVPLQIILPIIITKMNHPRRPMDLYLKAFPYRLAFNLVGALFVFVTPLIIKANTDIPFYYFILLTGILAIHQVATSAMYVQQMAFFAMVSDADAGGTYMTLLNTLANLGGTWTSTTALAAVDSFTKRSCVGSNLTITNDCSGPSLQTQCTLAGGICNTDVDGYYVEIALLTVVGALWFWFGRKKIDYLQSRPLSTWVVPRR